MVREIDLQAIAHNILLLSENLPDRVERMAVVKADAYGHGAVPVARTALQNGCSQLAVATPQEGAALRQAGIRSPILVLGCAGREGSLLGISEGLTLTVASEEDALWAGEAARQLGKQGCVHLKLDTGMHRIGIQTLAERERVLQKLKSYAEIQLTGAFTHFADADGADDQYTRLQFASFCRLTEGLPSGILRHCANSAAVERYMPEMTMDMVRLGISMYGYPPVDTKRVYCPALSWYSHVTFVKDIQAGDAVSYGCTFVAEKPMRVATIRCGYGDGYHRMASGKAEVLIRGHRCRVLGRICMDQMMADVTQAGAVQPGERVTLIGRDGEESITAEDLARWCGTISYEVLLSSAPRVHREYIGAPGSNDIGKETYYAK